MKKPINSGILAFAITLSFLQTTHAQGTVYLSNLGQVSIGTNSVGNNSWQAALFLTGTNSGGYLLNSIQLAMMGATGNPSGFTAMLYTAPPGPGALPGSSLGTFSGSPDPATGGTYTYTNNSNITLSPHTDYFIVLTSGTTVANGAYFWGYAGTGSYNPINGWSSTAGRVWTSNNGLSWNLTSGIYPQFAIDATAIPEPGVLRLLALGGLGFLWQRRRR